MSIHFHDFQVEFTESVEAEMSKSYGEEHWNRIKKVLCVP